MEVQKQNYRELPAVKPGSLLVAMKHRANLSREDLLRAFDAEFGSLVKKLDGSFALYGLYVEERRKAQDQDRQEAETDKSEAELGTEGPFMQDLDPQIAALSEMISPNSWQEILHEAKIGFMTDQRQELYTIQDKTNPTIAVTTFVLETSLEELKDGFDLVAMAAALNALACANRFEGESIIMRIGLN